MSNLRNSENLKSKSRKKILFDCDDCCKEVEQSYSSYLNQPGELKLCRSCRNRHTVNREDVKKKISESTKKNWEDEDYKNKVSSSLSIALKKVWDKKDNRKPSNKTTWEEIVYLFKRFEKMGFKLLTNEDLWNDFAGKIKCKCSYGHINEYSLAQLKKVKSCYLCIRENSINKKLLEDDKKEKKIIETFKKLEEFFYNYEIIKVDYNGTRNSKLLFKCKNNHIFEYPNWHRKMKQNEKLDSEICPECFKNKVYKNESFIYTIEITEEQVNKDYVAICNKPGNYNSVQMYSSPVLYFQWKEYYKNELKAWQDETIRNKLYANRLKYKGKTKEQLTNKQILLGLKIARTIKII